MTSPQLANQRYGSISLSFSLGRSERPRVRTYVRVSTSC